jgi:transcriptional pleiotropic regulator of transition state genes
MTLKGEWTMIKSTGIVRKVDELGRIVVPIELRRTLNINEKDALEIYTDGDRIVLKKYQPGCVQCGVVGAELFGPKHNICRDCIQKLNDEVKE